MHALSRSCRPTRAARIPALLAAEGLAAFETYRVPVVRFYVDSNEGSEESVLAACRAVQAADQAAELAQQARRASLVQALQAEGVPPDAIDSCYQALDFIQHGYGSEEEALASARTQHERAQRRAAVVAALAAEGLPEGYASYCQELSEYIGGYASAPAGGLEGTMAAARLQHEREQAREARRDTAAAALLAEGLPEAFIYSMPSIRAHIRDGGSDQEALLQEARAQHAADQAREARRTAMNALLAAADLPARLRSRVPALVAYIDSGKGSEEDALLAARAYHSTAPDYGYGMYGSYW